MKRVVFAGLVITAVLAGGCGKKVSRPTYPGTEEGAKQVAGDFLKPGANLGNLSMALRPDPADYDAMFDAETAAKVKAEHAPLWDTHKLVLRPVKATQTELLMPGGSTTEDLKAGNEAGKRCPTGYKDFAAHMKPGITIYCFRFVEPGQKMGSAYDGLAYVNGHWALFPKPYHQNK